MHPLTRLLCWLAAVIALQRLPLPGLLLALMAAMLTVIHGVGQRWWRLVRRSRWLLLSMMGVFLLSVPGTAIWPELGRWGPTVEGSESAVTHLSRLMLVLWLVAWLLETTSEGRLMAAIHALLHPLAGIGVSAERVVVRLALVLRYSQVMPSIAHWRVLLGEILRPAPAKQPEPVVLGRESWCGWDFVLLGLAALLLGRLW